VELAGSIKTHRQLMINGIEVSQNTVTSNIKRIRKKFKTIDPNFKAIETDFGRGYLWQKDK
jgi:two-component system OmpR family response regulator